MRRRIAADPGVPGVGFRPASWKNGGVEILLVTPARHRGGRPWGDVLAGALAAGLRAAGDRVRWLRAVPGAGAGADGVGDVEVREVAGAVAELGAVEQEHRDPAFETALVRGLRERPVDLVHVIGHGAPGSAAVPWLAERLGAAVVVTVRAEELLCHRGTLIDDTGWGCWSWEDPGRCTTCCREAVVRRVGVMGKLLPSRALKAAHRAFETRLDLVLAPLQQAVRVTVPHGEAIERVRAAGVARQALMVVPDGAGPEVWREVHAAAAAAGAGGR